MRIITPITVDDTSLKSSSIPVDDDGYPEWERGLIFNEHLLLVQSAQEALCYYKSGSTHTYQDVIDTSAFAHISSLSLNPPQLILLVFGEHGGEWGIHKYIRRKTSAGVSYNYSAVTDLISPYEDASSFQYCALEWSPDGRYLAVGSGAVSHRLSLYYFDGDNFFEMFVSGGSVDSSAFASDLSFSRDSKFLAFSGFNGESASGMMLRVYEIIDKNFAVEKNLDPSISNLRYPGYVTFSPADNLLVRTVQTSTTSGAQVLSYDEVGTFTEEADALGINTDAKSLTLKPSFSYDGRYVAFACMHANDWIPANGAEAERLYFYEYDGTDFTVITDPATTPASRVRYVKFSKTDYHVYVNEDSSPYFQIYFPDSNDVFQQITGPTTMPGAFNYGSRLIETASKKGWGYKSIVQFGNYLYESTRDGNMAAPNEDATVMSWIELSPINRWKMFDEYANTTTTEDGQITVQIVAEGIEHIGLLGLSGASEVTVTRYNSSDVSQWTTTESTTNTDRIIIDLDEATGGSGDYVEVVIGSSTDDDVSVARCFPGGAAVTYPNLQYGMEYSPMSFGKTIENDFGNVYLKQGNYADEFDCQVIISNTSIDTMFKFFRDYRETNLLWDLNGSTTDYEFLITYGFYLGRPRFVMQHPNDSIVNFKIREFT